MHSYYTRNNGLFMSHNDLDLQTGDLILYGCLPVVMQYQAEYVLLNHIQKYRTTIAYLIKGCAFLLKIMKEHNQRRKGNDVTLTFLRLYVCTINAWYICTLKLIQLFKSVHPQRVQMKK